jgi:hypothetical protein
VFDDSNTQKLLRLLDKKPLQMDEEMIKRIIKGYHDSSSITK